jgi:prepilin-type N-terminal cleavage/methylation domain-containing protein
MSLNTTDNAKPRAIVGRKATGPSGNSGLPKSDRRPRVALASPVGRIRFLFGETMKNQQGLTIIELLLALGILSVISLSLLVPNLFAWVPPFHLM